MLMEKGRLRKSMKQRLKQLNDNTYQEWSKQVAYKLFSLKCWKQASTIGVTISRNREVNTNLIIEKGWDQHKKIAVPKCVSSTEMTFHTFTKYNQLEKGYAGILEPLPKKTTHIDVNDIDLLVVPGLIYNKKGYRIGYGGGYYDRLLVHYTGQTVALAFEFQVINDLPIDDYDIPVKKIITNKRVITCN